MLHWQARPICDTSLTGWTYHPEGEVVEEVIVAFRRDLLVRRWRVDLHLQSAATQTPKGNFIWCKCRGNLQLLKGHFYIFKVFVLHCPVCFLFHILLIVELRDQFYFYPYPSFYRLACNKKNCCAKNVPTAPTEPWYYLWTLVVEFDITEQ